jgi:arginyl-tRNA synthetase
VTFIVDGERPNCKRDIWLHRKECKLDEINRLYCCFKALELGSNNMNKRSSSSNIDEEDATYDVIKIDFDLFSSESKSLENNKFKSTLSTPKDFGLQISGRLMMIDACNINENSGVVNERVLVASFKADSLIA